MLYFQMPYVSFTVTAMEGGEAYVVFSDPSAECGHGEPKVFPLLAGETLTFDHRLDGFNDPMPRKYFASSSDAAYFIEFVHCAVDAVE